MGVIKKIHAAYDVAVAWLMHLTGLDVQPYKLPERHMERVLDAIEADTTQYAEGTLYEFLRSGAEQHVYVDDSVKVRNDARGIDRIRIRGLLLFIVRCHNISVMYEKPDRQVRSVKGVLEMLRERAGRGVVI